MRTGVRFARKCSGAALWIAIAQGGAALAQGGAGTSKDAAAPPLHCHVLNMIEKDLSEALKKCGETASLFKPELFRSEQRNDLFANGGPANGLLTLFGQGGFGTSFSLDIDSSYIVQDKDADGSFGKAKQPVLGGTVRGGLIEDNTDDLGQPTVKSGRVVWTATSDGSSRISSVVGMLAIDESKITLRLSVSPAEAGKGLVMAVKLSGESGAECGIPRMRRTGDRSGEPLDMVGRNPTEGEFLFVPSADTQAAKNILSALLKSQWIDVPVRPHGGASYTLTMELARPGQQLLLRALENWNLAPQRP